MKRFGRTENIKTERGKELVWAIYESENEGDYKNGKGIAWFVRRDDALSFSNMATTGVEKEEERKG